MKFKLRPYQEEASKKAVEFFLDKKKNWNALEVLPTASGKSLILADIAARLKDKVLVFSPTKEILEQNYKKYCSYGFDNASIYSASFKSKEISDVTFATIGSVKGHPELFTDYERFGKVEDLKLLDQNGKGKWVIMSGNKQLTNAFF